MKTLAFRPLAAVTASSALACVLGAVPAAYADRDHHRSHRVSTQLSGFNEVHFVAGPPAAMRGAISTKGKGSFKARIDDDLNMISYELTYSELDGTVTQAHIHLGQEHTVGGITVWLCQTATNPAPAAVAAATPMCPAEGTVMGTILPAQVLAPAAQGLLAGDFDALVRAIRAGATYANVHSSIHGPGEIRGQIGTGKDRD